MLKNIDPYVLGFFFFLFSTVQIAMFFVFLYHDLEEEKKQNGTVSIDFFIKKFIKFVFMLLFIAFVYKVFEIKGIDVGKDIKIFITKSIGR